MKRALINPEICKNCSNCLIELNCFNKAIIREEAEQIPYVDFYKCSGCMKCKNYCHNNAVLEVSQPCTGKAKAGW